MAMGHGPMGAFAFPLVCQLLARARVSVPIFAHHGLVCLLCGSGCSPQTYGLSPKSKLCQFGAKQLSLVRHCAWVVAAARHPQPAAPAGVRLGVQPLGGGVGLVCGLGLRMGVQGGHDQPIPKVGWFVAHDGVCALPLAHGQSVGRVVGPASLDLPARVADSTLVFKQNMRLKCPQVIPKTIPKASPSATSKASSYEFQRGLPRFANPHH